MTPDIKTKLASKTSQTSDRAGLRSQSALLAEGQLRLASVRITGARVNVLTALLEARCAVSHQDMQDLFVDMDRVTLYRALDCLTDAGLAHKIAGDDRVFLYSAGAEHTESASSDPLQPSAHAQHQHGHFKCTRCGKVFCLDGSGEAGFLGDVLAPVIKDPAGSATATASPALLRQHLQQALQESLGQGFEGHDIELTIKGWCADCAH
ncbi:Fur family transcriptional regulator [Glaciimonas immobilis]|uniref:Fur family ferric uptake transcriptional regulator n=1 Tax=Glaciimonas immobilis TaxID=728004 RepID=A0A840RZX0_9BURK|nr:transcriptional repressor [Glaciimonas immobilis]KAF3997303.1 transcriptional repressor [Glaciimonas immobilis]MBB5202396.1 Fur family ferric uptake transcriptional regulator [Glaciimonas immobilis]